MLNSTERLQPAAAPIPENLPTTATTSSVIAQHWADLTTKGQTQFNDFSDQRFTEHELLDAFESGKAALPPGSEALMAYYINAISLFVKNLGTFPPFVARPSESSNNLAIFLCSSNDFFLLSSMLQVFGSMDASIPREGQVCRKISENQLEIAWKTEPPLFLHLPLVLENSLKLIGEALRTNEPVTAQRLSQALALFIPSYSDLPAQGHVMGRNEALDEIYRVLVQRKYFYAAFKLLFLFKGSGWNPLDTGTVLDLPEQLKFIAKSNQFNRLLPALRAAYAGTRFACVLEDMVVRVQNDPERASESLLVCNDVGILSSVWKSNVEKRDDFLVEAAAMMPVEALPFALAHVCKSDQIRVACAYYERILKQEPPFVFAATYQPLLERAIAAQLKSNPTELRAYPRVMQIFQPEQVTISSAGPLMDLWNRNHFFPTDHKIIHDVAAVLVKGPTDERLWSRWHTVVGGLVKDDAYLEDVVVLFETLAPTAPSCLEVAIPRMGKRLTANQKHRLSLAYASALEKNPRVLTALPSEKWLLDQLRRDDCLQEFTRVACHLGATTEAEWIAPRLLTMGEAPLFASFEALVCRLPKRDLDATVWKPHLAGLLARNPKSGALFDKLYELASTSEKVDLQRCRKLKAEEMQAELNTYRVTGAFPDHTQEENAKLRREIQAAIGEKNFEKAVTLFKRTTEAEWELWGNFIGALPDNLQSSLAESAWTVWAQKHPVATFKQEESTHWESAFVTLFGKTANNSDSFVNFLKKQAFEYALRLSGKTSSVFLRLCLEKGTLSCWSAKTDQCGARLQTLSTLISNKKLMQRHESVAGLLTEHYQVYLHLLFIQHEKFYDVGNSWFLDNIGKSPLGAHFLKGYSMKPYIPRSLEDQIAIINWLKKSYPINYAQITWMETSKVFSALCNFKVEPMHPVQRACYFLLLGVIWDQLLEGLPGLRANDPKQFAELFLGLTQVFLIRANKYIDNKKTKCRILSSARFAFYTHVSTHIPFLEVLKFQLNHCSYLFALIPFDFPDTENLLKNTLDDFNLNILQLQGNNENLLKIGVNTFREALPTVLMIPDPEILQCIQILMGNLITTPCVVEAKPEEKFSWSSLLVNMCAGFQKAEGKWAPEVAKLACEVFMNCTHPDKVKAITGKLDRKLINSSCDILGTFFLNMPKPECLEVGMWTNLIQGLSNSSMERIALILFKEVGTLPTIGAYPSHMALGMLIQHTKPSTVEVLQYLEEYCDVATGDFFHSIGVRCDAPLQLRLHSQWVSTLVSLTQKCKAFERTPLLVLTARKIAIATTMTTIACAMIKDDATYKLYSPYLFRALGDDLDVIRSVHDTLVPGEVESLKQFKMVLERKIQSLGKAK